MTILLPYFSGLYSPLLVKTFRSLLLICGLVKDSKSTLVTRLRPTSCKLQTLMMYKVILKHFVIPNVIPNGRFNVLCSCLLGAV